jgi:hypothetical protein
VNMNQMDVRIVIPTSSGKLQLPLCLIKHHNIKKYRGVTIQHRTHSHTQSVCGELYVSGPDGFNRAHLQILN